MTQTPQAHALSPDMHQDTFSKNVLGFWVYLMTDCILFATLFATYAVLHRSTFGGPTAQEIISLPTTIAETAALLLSSVMCGLGMLAACRNKKKELLTWLVFSFILGATFIALELTEFTQLVRDGNSWERSAFLSSFFTLVGTHGTHVSFGLLWMTVLLVQIGVKGITATTFRRLVCFSLFWHFLDLVWIFIFTFVYLMGVL